MEMSIVLTVKAANATDAPTRKNSMWGFHCSTRNSSQMRITHVNKALKTLRITEGAFTKSLAPTSRLVTPTHSDTNRPVA